MIQNVYIAQCETGLSAAQEIARPGRTRLYKVCVGFERYTGAPSYIFHNQHKTLNNLN